MAELESKIILNAETGEAVSNVAELKRMIADYRNSLDDVNKTYEENKEIAGKLANAQATLRDVMNSVSEESVKSAKGINTSTASYNDLVKATAVLTKEWRATTDTVERSKLGEKIKEINDKLKDLDATKGTFQRNVGNYAGSIKEVFGGVATGIGNTIPAIGGVNNAFKMLSANPIMLVVTTLVTVFNEIVKGIRSSKENTDKLSKAFSSFSVIGTLITKLFQQLGAVVVKVAEWFGKFADKAAEWLGVSTEIREEQERNQKTAQKEIELQKKRRDNIIQNAKDEQKIAKLRADANEKDVRSTRERIKLLEDASNLELEIMKRAKEEARLAYEIAKEKADRAGSTQEELEEVSKLHAEMIKADTAYYNKTRELNGQIAELRIKAKGETLAIEKAQNEEIKKAREQLEKDLEALDKQISVDMQQAISDSLKAEQQANEDARAELSERLANIDQYVTHRKTMASLEIEDEEEKAETLYNIQQTAYQEKLALIEQYQLEAEARGDLQGQLALEEQYSEMSIKIEEETQKRKTELRKQAVEEEKRIEQSRKQLAMTALSSMSAIMSAMADQYESDTNASESELKKAKNLKIAAATIDMFQGIVAGWTSAMSLPFPINLAMGALATATTTTLGLMNISKIKSQNISKNSSNSSGAGSTPSISASVPAPSVPQEIQTYRALTSNSEEERLDQMASPNKVYLVTSELEAKQNDEKIILQETTF